MTVRSFLMSSSVSLCLWGYPFVAAADEPQVTRRESVEVDRVVVDVRVLDGHGRPVRGLLPEHFALEVDGRDVPLESVRWVDDGPGRAAAAPATDTESEDPPPALPDRLLLLLFQKDLKGSRGEGLLRMQSYARGMIGHLGAHDRVAVASHDSHLHLWLDFTTDRGTAQRSLAESVVHGRRLAQPPEDGPSLRAALDPEAARHAATPEAAVRVLAEAMAGLPGTKTMILFGWGMGELGPTGVRMTHEYEPAVAALARAGVSVFTLDLTNADYHSLEAGLQQVAEDTGGTYARTHDFPATAVRQLEAALAGHYVLSFERPDLARGEHRMRVRLRGRRGDVLARTTYVDPE